MLKNFEEFIITNNEAITLQVWTKRNFPHISYVLLKQLLRKKLIITSAKTNQLLKQNQKIYIHKNFIRSIKKKQISTHAIKPMIIFENENYAIINKPTNLSMQGNANSIAQLTNAFITHRLDKTTSGIAIIAKNAHYANLFSQNFKQRKIEKIYIALCHKPQNQIKSQGTWKNNINNKEAITEYKVLKQTKTKILLQLKPKTGRKHQLRIHCAQNDMPIIGDTKYRYGFQRSRIYLHSYKITFEIDQKKHEYKAPIPFSLSK